MKVRRFQSSYASILTLALILGIFLVAGCGGGGGGEVAPIRTVSANGIWVGTFAEAGVGTFDSTALLYNGRIIAISETAGVIYDGTYTVTGNSLSANVTAYEAGGGIFATSTLSGTVIEQSSITGTFSTSYGTNGTVTLAFDDIYNRSSSLLFLEGNWSYADRFYNLTLTVNSDGAFFGQDTEGCILSGKFSILESDHNLYDIDLTVQSCGVFDGSYDGFSGFFDDVTTNDSLQVVVSNANFIKLLPLSRGHVSTILSDQPADGDIAYDPVLQTFTITNGPETIFFGIDDLDPSLPEFCAFLDFPLDGSTGFDVVPSAATIISATLEIFVNEVSFAAIVPTLLDLVVYPISGLQVEDFDSLPFLTQALDFLASDQGAFVSIDVTPLMREAQRLGFPDFQLRFVLDFTVDIGFVGIQNLSNVAAAAPLLTVVYDP